MILFWLSILIITTLGMLFIAWPFFFFQEKKIRLDTEMHFDVNSRLFLVFILCFLLLGAALSLYLYFGKSKELASSLTSQKRAKQVQAEISKYGSRQQIIQALRTRLDGLPKNKDTAKGWFILGKLYFNEQNFPQAKVCFNRAVELSPNELDYTLQLVSLNFYLQHSLSEKDKQLLERLLILSPNNINALNLLALNDYQHEHYEQAIRRWENLLDYFPSDSADAQSLVSMIHQAQIKTNNIQITVSVNISATLRNKLSPTDTLFIYAKGVNGSKIPIAVARYFPTKLPITISLSNANCMLPGKSLAKGEKIYCEARVSKTGNALLSKGDMFGKSQPMILDMQNNTARIIINQH